eukprot:gene804-biopygen1563
MQILIGAVEYKQIVKPKIRKIISTLNQRNGYNFDDYDDMDAEDLKVFLTWLIRNEPRLRNEKEWDFGKDTDGAWKIVKDGAVWSDKGHNLRLQGQPQLQLLHHLRRSYHRAHFKRLREQKHQTRNLGRWLEKLRHQLQPLQQQRLHPRRIPCLRQLAQQGDKNNLNRKV